jgi:hypothetical protein
MKNAPVLIDVQRPLCRRSSPLRGPPLCDAATMRMNDFMLRYREYVNARVLVRWVGSELLGTLA